jgi:Zn-dependent protease
MGNVFGNLDWSVLTNALISVVPALLCITIHELAHGYTAYRLGDNTAKEMGRLTLNPIKHIDPLGLLMMVLVGFGWAKPVPVGMGNFKNPKRYMAITALAGPVSNLLLAFFVMFIFGFAIVLWGGMDAQGGFVAKGADLVFLEMLHRTAWLSIMLAVFNMLPIPPLDGSKVVFSVISDAAYMKLMQYERYGMILLIALMAFGVLNQTIGVAVDFLYSAFFVAVRAGAWLVS